MNTSEIENNSYSYVIIIAGSYYYSALVCTG